MENNEKENQISKLKDLQENLYKYFINSKTILNTALSRDNCIAKRDCPDVYFVKKESHELEDAKSRIEKERKDNAKVINEEIFGIILSIIFSLLITGIVVLFLLNPVEGIIRNFPFINIDSMPEEMFEIIDNSSAFEWFWIGMVMLEIRVIMISIKRIKFDYDIVDDHVISKSIYWIITLLLIVKNISFVWSHVHGALLVVFVLLLILCIFVKEIVSKCSDIIYDNSIKETKKHKKELIEAAERDEKKNAEYLNTYEQQKKEWEEKGKPEHVAKMQKMIDEYQKEIDTAYQELEVADKAINENNIIADSEKEIDVVEKLLYFLESGRADNIKEALNLYDTAKSRDGLAELQRVQNDISKNGFEKMSSLLNEQINVQNNILETEKMFMEQNHADMLNVESKLDNMSSSLNNMSSSLNTISNKITDYANVSSSQRARLSSQLGVISGKLSTISNVQSNAALNEYVSDYYK